MPSADERQLLNAPKCPQLLPYLDGTWSGSCLMLYSPLLPCSLAELRLRSPGLSTMQVFQETTLIKIGIYQYRFAGS